MNVRLRNVVTLGTSAAVATLALTAAAPQPSATSVIQLIRKQSQEFSDASAKGDVKTLARLLDDNVTFVNENGEIGTKKDLTAGGPPPPTPGVTNELVQRDLHVQLYGTTAVTSFVDESTLRFHGQVLVSTFRSTEVWIERRDGWKMISSQTIALQNDPPAIALPSDELAEYVGTYAAGPGYDIAIARSGGDLTASVDGGAPVTWKAEVRDVFFVPGQPRLRRIFQRDPSGTIVGFVTRREGHDIAWKRQS
jgi:ketosteroid isomerase-like protein